MMLAKVALIDPELTLGLPPAITAQTGLDTLTQLLEAYVCHNANPFVDAFCEQGMARVREALPRCFRDGGDVDAREDMSYASLLSGLALSNAGLGVIHGFAGPAGGTIDAPHGAICAALLVAGVRANVSALQTREPAHPAIEKYTRAARILTGNRDATAEELCSWLAVFVAGLNMRGLQALGFQVSSISDLVSKATKASSMKANPVVLTTPELTQVIEQSL
jgi:alcohol dehydrogenase class IV